MISRHYRSNEFAPAWYPCLRRRNYESCYGSCKLPWMCISLAVTVMNIGSVWIGQMHGKYRCSILCRACKWPVYILRVIKYSRSHSSFRKGLQTGIAHDVDEVSGEVFTDIQITQHLESGLLQSTGNEIRRTKRSISVIDVLLWAYNNVQKDRRCELSKQDRILASIP